MAKRYVRVLAAVVAVALCMRPLSLRAGQDPVNPAAPGQGLARTPEFQAKVDKAIASGVAWLKKAQVEDGSFRLDAGDRDAHKMGGRWQKGANALAVYTLGACEVPSEDPALVRGFRRLRTDWDERPATRLDSNPTGGSQGVTTYFASLALLALDLAHNRNSGPLSKGKPGGGVPMSQADARWVDEMVEWLCCAQDPGKTGKRTLPREPGGSRKVKGAGSSGAAEPKPTALPGDPEGGTYPSLEEGGGFCYGASATPGGWHDHSNMQFALLGLKSAARLGADVPDSVWLRALRHLIAAQEPVGPGADSVDAPGVKDPGSTKPTGEGGRSSGGDVARGWGYMCPGSWGFATGGDEASLPMTAGGVSSLLVCRSELDGVAACTPRLRQLAEKGMRDGYAWLALHFQDRPGILGQRPGLPPPGVRVDGASLLGVNLYGLYGLERACVLGGALTLRGKDWYLEGAERILALQRPDGSFLAAGTNGTWDLPLIDSCFALLFLKKAVFRVPDRWVATDPTTAEPDSVEALLSRYAGATPEERTVLLSRFLGLGIGVVPKLILKMEGADSAARATAFEVLHALTGQDFGFSAKDPVAERKEAVQRWREWWTDHEGRLVPDPNSGRFIERK